MSTNATMTPSQQDTLRTRWRAQPRLLMVLWQVGWHDVLVLLGLSLATGLMSLIGILVLRQLIDSGVRLVEGTETFSTAALWLGVFLLATLLQDSLGVTSEWLGDDIQERLKLHMQGRVLAKASSLALADFEQPDAYDQLQRAQQGLDTRLFTTMQQLVPVPGLVVTVISLLIFLGTASPFFPLVLLAGVVPAAIVHVRFFGRKYALDRAQTAPKRMLEALTLLMAERPSAAEVRLFGLRDYLITRWDQLFGALRSERLRLADRQALVSTTLEITDKLTLGLVIAGCIAQIALGRLSLGSFAAFLSAVGAFTNAVYLVLWNLTTTDSDLRYIRDVLDYLDRPGEPSRRVTQSSVRVSGPLPEVHFQQVSFRYPDTQDPILIDIDLVLRPGERVALVGANGAGKTTLAKLLLGLYRPTVGRILVDGIDSATLDPSIWRSRVAAVFQDFVRYELTANENIAFGDLQRQDNAQAIMEAARRAGADSVLGALPDGGNTMLGKVYDERGADLSGGQWQRLAIARAYLRDADVLILDEPTAALDPRAEVEIYRQFRDAAQGRTTVLISHRLGSARLADRIVVLERGRIVESGTHAELLAQTGRYAELYRAQAEWYR